MAVTLGKCKLCLREGLELQRSHFIPASAYRTIRKSMDQAPIVIKSSVTIRKDEQITDYVLCVDCEQRFNKNGEAWMVENCHQPGGEFRLKGIIEGQRPFASGQPMTMYSAVNTPNIDIERMTYFVSSIIWRGSAHRWKSGREKVISPSLGPYQECFRRYLLAETEFPQNAAIWISVVTDPNLFGTVAVPYGERTRTCGAFCWQYKFVFLGISAMLFVGREINPIIQRTCSYRSPEKFIFMGDTTNEMILNDFGKIIRKSRRIGSLAKP